MRVTADGGALKGFEFTVVFTGVGDLALTMSFDYPTFIEGATQAAVHKAADELGTGRPGTA